MKTIRAAFALPILAMALASMPAMTQIILTTTLTSSTTNGRRAQRFSRKTGTEAIRSIISRTTFAVRQRDMSGARSMGIT